MDPVYKDLLYRSFDEELGAEDKATLERALVKNAMLRNEKEAIKEVRSLVGQNTRKTFSEGFADRVMQQFNQRESNFDSALFRLFKSLAVAASFLIVAMLGYNISTSDQLTLENMLAVPDISVNETAELVYLSDLME